MMSRRSFLSVAGSGMVAAGLALGQTDPAAAEPGTGGPWGFAVVSDPHLREDRANEPPAAEKFRRVLAKLTGLDPRPEFLLLLGDIHVTHLEPLLPEIPIPVHPVMGNHEGEKDRELLRRLFPTDLGKSDFYAFEHGGSLFLGLCTAAISDHVGHFESQDFRPNVGQCQWLEEQLARKDRFRHVVIYGHIPPEAQGRPNGMCLGQNDSRYLLDLVKRRRPSALFFGHRHKRVDFDVDGVPLHGLRSCNWNSAGEPSGFLHVVAHPTRLEVRPVDC